MQKPSHLICFMEQDLRFCLILLDQQDKFRLDTQKVKPAESLLSKLNLNGY